MTLIEFINKIGFQVKNEDVKKVNDTISGIKSTATKLLGAIGIGFSLTQLNAIAEEFDGIGDRIAYAAGDAENLDEIMHKVLDSANASRTSLSQFADEVTNLKQANESIFPLEEATTFVEYVNKLGKAAGYSDSEISTMQSSIQRVVASGQMAAADLNRIGRQTPALITTICDGLGVTREELDKMADSGKLTAETIKTAMMNSTGQIDEAFSQLNFGVSDALLHIRNKWGFWVDETNKMFGITNGLGNFMVKIFSSIMKVLDKARNGVVWLSEKVGGANNLLKLLAIVAGSLFIAFNFSKIVSGFQTIMKAVGGLNLKLLAIAAIIIIVALLVEDFINFMQGNDSLLGSLLEKAGIDCDALRETVINAWNTIKEKLGVVWESVKEAGSVVWERIKEAAVAIFESLKAFWDKWGGTITATFQKIFGFIGDVFNAFIDVVVGIVNFIGAIFKGDWAAAWQAIQDIFVGIWDAIVAFIQGVWEWIKLIFQIAWDFILGIITAIWEGIKSFFLGIWESIVSYFQGVWQSICDVFSGVVEWFSGIFSAAWEGIKNIFSAVGGFFQGIWDTIKNIFVSIGQTIADGVSGAFKATVNAVIGFAEKIINGFIGGINAAIGLINKIPGVNIPKISTVNIPKLAEGGYVEANNPQHVIIGDNKQEGEIVSPVSKMKEAMYDVMRMFSSTLRPTQATQALVQPERSYVITQNIEFNNEFNGDAAIQRSASNTMDKSAKDVTAQLARGLAYAR